LLVVKCDVDAIIVVLLSTVMLALDGHTVLELLSGGLLISLVVGIMLVNPNVVVE
jgi:hypothetical protein